LLLPKKQKKKSRQRKNEEPATDEGASKGRVASKGRIATKGEKRLLLKIVKIDRITHNVVFPTTPSDCMHLDKQLHLTRAMI
jgi:hypothetical protein